MISTVMSQRVKRAQKNALRLFLGLEKKLIGKDYSNQRLLIRESGEFKLRKKKKKELHIKLKSYKNMKRHPHALLQRREKHKERHIQCIGL